MITYLTSIPACSDRASGSWRYSTRGGRYCLARHAAWRRDDIDRIETLANGHRRGPGCASRHCRRRRGYNRAVAELLARRFVPKANVKILSEATSRLKQVAVDGESNFLVKPWKTDGGGQIGRTGRQRTEMTDIIDGKSLLRSWLASPPGCGSSALHGATPGLAVVLVSTDPASEVYMRSKHQTQAAGMTSFELIAGRCRRPSCWRSRKTQRDPLGARRHDTVPLPNRCVRKPSSTPSTRRRKRRQVASSNAGRLFAAFFALSPCTAAQRGRSSSKSVHASLGHERDRDRHQPGRTSAGAIAAQRARHG